MALHQPALTHHRLPHWVEYIAIAMVVVAIAIGSVLVIQHLNRPAEMTSPDRLVIAGSHGGGIEYTGIPYRSVTPAWVVLGSHGGGIIYVGIPYPPPGA